jgi:hypothetical protein
MKTAIVQLQHLEETNATALSTLSEKRFEVAFTQFLKERFLVEELNLYNAVC